MRSERDEIGKFTNRGELLVPKELHRHRATELREVEFRALDVSREVKDAQDALVVVATDETEDLAILGAQDLEGPSTEGPVALAKGDQATHPPQQRVGVLLLRLDVDRLIVILGVDDGGQVQTLGVGAGEPGVTVTVPLHRRAHRVAVA